MSFNMRFQTDLLQLLNAGASLTLDAGMRSTVDLIQLASAARNGGGTLTLKNLSMRTTVDLIQIVSAGKGHIVLSD